MMLNPLRRAVLLLTAVSLASAVCSPQTVRQNPESFGVRGGVGTDIELGLGFGAGAFYVWTSGSIGFELGADVYYHHSTETYEEERGVTVNGEDVTTLIIFGVRANGLFNFRPSRRSVYFIAGVGFVVASLEWTRKETAPNWTQPYRDQADGTAVGNIVNLGVGIPLTRQLDIRLEFPMLFLYSSYGNAATFVPTATLGLVYRFR